MTNKNKKDLVRTNRDKKDRKSLISEVWRREDPLSVAKYQAEVRARSYLRLPPTFMWLNRFSWIVPILHERFGVATISPEEAAAYDQSIAPADKDTSVATEVETNDSLTSYQVSDYVYRQYPCLRSDPLGCDRPLETIQQEPAAKYCQQCGFPAILPEKVEIRGIRGRYRVESFLERRGMGRLYRGVQVSDEQPIVIKEYLLPTRCFNTEEARQRKSAFTQLAGLSLADGRVQDFRAIAPWEAIADENEERCYLITKGNLDIYPSLRHHLKENGQMDAIAVRQFLNLVLQSLEFLHGQKFRLPSGQVQQGIPHGNITLDSLLIDKEKFFIYLCDQSLWERLFDLPTSEPYIPTIAGDLVDVGYVAFYLLAGRVVDPVTRLPVDPKDDNQWPIVDPALKGFIFRLCGYSVPFQSAEEARRVLLKIPVIRTTPATEVVELEPDEDEPSNLPRMRLILFLLLALGLTLLGTLLWLWLYKPKTSQASYGDLPICCIKDVAGVPSGKFRYTGEEKGTWSYVLQQKNLVEKGQSLEKELQRRKPNLELMYEPVSYGLDSSAEPLTITKVRSGEAEFAITSLVNQLSGDLEYKKFGYDGLAIFVAFSYAQREKSLPKFLEGKITLDQLRKLYTGKITNWNQIPGGPDLPVKLYMPPEAEAVQIFEQRVLKNKTDIEAFRKLIKKEENKQEKDESSFVNSTPPVEIHRIPTFTTLRNVIEDFEQEKEEQVGAIAFGTFSKVFGQCSAYPLALVEDGKTPVQALIQSNGQPIEPTSDLCNDKGSYHPNIDVFRNGTYPLAYPMAVVYPRDNSRSRAGAKFADILRTEESQRLLSKTGIVPLQPKP